jgi:arginyl-tRNA synthetase
MGHADEAECSVHFSYEMVTLSHGAARALGFTEIDTTRPFVEVSGRKGLGVKADDLLDRLADAASHEVIKRNPDLSGDESSQIARVIATAAVRYFMIKYSRGKVIVFDIDEALSFEGESGPYLQYAVVRAANIFRKLHERTGLDEAAVVASLASLPGEALARGEGDDLWGLVLEAARLDEVVDQALRGLEPSVLAKYAFGLAQTFNAFYHHAPILKETQADRQRWRAAAALYFKAQMTRALAVMGCEVPSRM